jgi:hypothetical protein
VHRSSSRTTAGRTGSDEATSDGSLDGGYVFNVTYPTINGTMPRNLKVKLFVLKTYYNYYVPLGSTYLDILLRLEENGG